MDSIDYKMVYGMGLKADMLAVIAYLDTLHLVSENDIIFKNRLLSRFKYKTEVATLPEGTDQDLVSLYRVFEAYWRESLLQPTINRDSIFQVRLIEFFESKNEERPFTKGPITKESLKGVFQDFIDAKGVHSTDFGKTGKLYDLLLWNTEVPEEYHVKLMDTSIVVTVFYGRFCFPGVAGICEDGQLLPRRLGNRRRAVLRNQRI